MSRGFLLAGLGVAVLFLSCDSIEKETVDGSLTDQAVVEHASCVKYVDAQVGIPGDGSSWVRAFRTVEEAVYVANTEVSPPDSCEVRVAEGTAIPQEYSGGKKGNVGDRVRLTTGFRVPNSSRLSTNSVDVNSQNVPLPDCTSRTSGEFGTLIPGLDEAPSDVYDNAIPRTDITDGYIVLKNVASPSVTFDSNNGSYTDWKLQDYNGDLTFYSGIGSWTSQMVFDSSDDMFTIYGHENDYGTVGSLRIDSGSQELVMDGNEIDSSSSLAINHNLSSSVYMVYGGGSVGIGLSYGHTFTYDGETMRLAVGGDVAVKGTIRCEEIIVDTVASDFVFEDSYHPMPLSEVESYVKTHKHLPDVPSAAEMEKTGTNVRDMQERLLQKIEELTLHAIEQEKRIHELEMKLSHGK